MSWAHFPSLVQAARGRVEHLGLPGSGDLDSDLYNFLSLGHQVGFYPEHISGIECGRSSEQEVENHMPCCLFFYSLGVKNGFYIFK